MRAAALYDIHGNLPALEAVLAEIGQADLIVVGGDVAWGPMPVETVERLMALADRAAFVMGNADREVAGRFDESGRPDVAEVTMWAHDRLSDRHRDFLRSFAATVALDLDELGPTLFCHGSPRSDTEEIGIATPDETIGEMLADVRHSTVVCGHTHRAFDRTVGGTRVVNPGSVGLPYGERGAFWALLGPDVELRRTDYDYRATAALLRESGMPHITEFVANLVPE